jgi:hypothetical protein
MPHQLAIGQLLPSRGGAYRSLRSRAERISGMRRWWLSAPSRLPLPRTRPLPGRPRSGSRRPSRRPAGDALCRPRRGPGRGPTGGSRLWRRQLSSHKCGCPSLRTSRRVTRSSPDDAEGGRGARYGAAGELHAACGRVLEVVRVGGHGLARHVVILGDRAHQQVRHKADVQQADHHEQRRSPMTPPGRVQSPPRQRTRVHLRTRNMPTSRRPGAVKAAAAQLCTS